MEKRKLLKFLRGMVVGGRIIINAMPHRIEEVVRYEENGERWLNLVWNEDDEEVALEVEGNKLTLWEQIASADVIIGKSVATYQEEEYSLMEYGEADTISITSGGEKKEKVTYWVYEGKSGKKLAVEAWGEDTLFYFADGELSAREVEII